MFEVARVVVLERHEAAVEDYHRVTALRVITNGPLREAGAFRMDPTRAIPWLNVNVLDQLRCHRLVSQHITGR